MNKLPLLNVNTKVDNMDKEKRENVIFDQVMKQLPPNNDKFYMN